MELKLENDKIIRKVMASGSDIKIFVSDQVLPH